jgi:hypothetical protein
MTTATSTPCQEDGRYRRAIVGRDYVKPAFTIHPHGRFFALPLSIGIVPIGRGAVFVIRHILPVLGDPNIPTSPGQQGLVGKDDGGQIQIHEVKFSDPPMRGTQGWTTVLLDLLCLGKVAKHGLVHTRPNLVQRGHVAVQVCLQRKGSRNSREKQKMHVLLPYRSSCMRF